MQAQYQNAQAKLQQSMPAYTVLQKPVMPYEASSTPRALIVAVYLLIGIVLNCVCVLFVYPLFKRKREGKLAKKNTEAEEQSEKSE